MASGYNEGISLSLRAFLMPLLYAVVFGLFSAWLVVLGVLLGGCAWLLLWPALSFAILASAYAGLGHRVFGKKASGRLAWWALLVLLPVLLLLWGLWHIQRLLSREPVCNEVAPGVWLGRRAFVHELPAGVVMVIDLAAEFPAPRHIRCGRDYLSMPTLDAGIPDEAAFRAALERASASASPVYIHCAQGHGRSALFCAALLLARGLQSSVSEAEKHLRKARPGVRLNPRQRRFLRRMFEKAG